MNDTSNKITSIVFYCTIFVISLIVSSVYAATTMAPNRIADIINTKHNFAANTEPDLPMGSTRKYSAVDQNELCVFCHTPHGRHKNDSSFVEPQPFLWNRKLHTLKDGYTMYSSDSFNATPSQPGASSKMCLSCHDGTVAIGQVDKFRLNGKLGSGEIAFANGLNKITDADVANSANLGVDFSNDHPVGFVYDATLANTDTELVDPDTVDYIGPRSSRIKTRIAVPLEKTAVSEESGAAPTLEDRVECTTCHDPHIRSTDNSVNIKFLRLNRFQKSDPSGSSEFNLETDINCLACHRKAGWRNSVHAVQSVANEVYTSSASSEREFPAGIDVWEVACLNCHDTHAASGSRWLLANGVVDGKSASEETCYKCHSSEATLTLDNVVNVADIKTEFTKISSMPISVTEEIHTISNSDLEETPANLGKDNRSKRHVECSDCHHPHRMMRAEVFNAPTVGDVGTHVHANGQVHSNILSGVLRGVTGIEPDYGTDETFDNTRLVTTGVVLKKGEPDTADGVDVDYATREYQICFKCHSDYAWPNLPTTLGDSSVTNVAMEFQPVNNDAESGINNHRSWHPVVGATGRINDDVDKETYITPFNQGLGEQTMYCSDCHTNTNGAPKGPHGSIHNNILSGDWSKETGSTTPNDLCFNCHIYDQYAPVTQPARVLRSGFSCATCEGIIARTNLHVVHANQGDASSKCGLCHVKIPHGWKNKALLVDKASSTPEDESIYYFSDAILRLTAGFKPAGQWEKVDCTEACHTP